jgi:hypothetical protein
MKINKIQMREKERERESERRNDRQTERESINAATRGYYQCMCITVRKTNTNKASTSQIVFK